MGEKVMRDWVACASDKACICPAGSNRGNHRQDQAALSLAMGMHGVTCKGPNSFVPPLAAVAAGRDPPGRDPPVDPTRVHWVRTHGIKPKCRDMPCVLAKHAPQCSAAYQATTQAAEAA